MFDKFENEDDFLSSLPKYLRDPIVKFHTAIKETISSLSPESSELFQSTLKQMKSLSHEVGEFIHIRASHLSDLFSKPLTFFKDTLEGAKNLADKVGNSFHEIKEKYDQLTDKPSHIFEGIKHWFDGLLGDKQEKTSAAEFNLYLDGHDHAAPAHSAIDVNGVATPHADMHSVM